MKQEDTRILVTPLATPLISPSRDSRGSTAELQRGAILPAVQTLVSAHQEVKSPTPPGMVAGRRIRSQKVERWRREGQVL